MAETKPDAPDWMEEFKKANAPAAPSAGEGNASKAERRKHSRFQVDDASVKLYRRGLTSFVGLAKLSIEGQAVDLSEGGVRIQTSEELLPQTKIHLAIRIEKFKDTFESDGEVRWRRRNPAKADEFTVGIQFSGMEGAQARKISSMRAWFISPQCAAQRNATRRGEKSGTLPFLK